MRLTDAKILLNRHTAVNPLQLKEQADKEGGIRGRAADGTPMKARIGGVSKARQLMMKAEERRRQEATERKRERQARKNKA